MGLPSRTVEASASYSRPWQDAHSVAWGFNRHALVFNRGRMRSPRLQGVVDKSMPATAASYATEQACSPSNKRRQPFLMQQQQRRQQR